LVRLGWFEPPPHHSQRARVAVARRACADALFKHDGGQFTTTPRGASVELPILRSKYDCSLAMDDAGAIRCCGFREIVTWHGPPLTVHG